MGRLSRRLISFPALVAAWLLLVLCALPALAVSFLVGLIRRSRFVLCRLYLLAFVYTSLEVVGLCAAGIAGIGLERDSAVWRSRHQALQRWWASSLWRAMCRAFDVEVRLEGDTEVRRGPFILLLRHANLADALIPAALVSRTQGVNFRYVMKRELLVDPCLDVVGNRLPNHFIDRAHPGDSDLRSIAALARNLGPRDGVVIYPEGTRFNRAKRERILSRMEAKGSPDLERAGRLLRTLPPRLGGVSALLDAAPGADVVICAHAGLGGFANLRDLLSKDMVGRVLHVSFRRIAANDIPSDPTSRSEWLYAEWERVDAHAQQHAPASLGSQGPRN